MGLNQRNIDFQGRWESGARSYPRSFPIAIGGAQGSYLKDCDGRQYIDFLSGAGVLALGHNHPGINAAIKRQIDVGGHYLDFMTDTKRAFIERNLEMMPPAMAKRMKVHFCGPTGADGVEAALKLAKTYTGRTGIFSFQGGFHGATQGTLAVTGLRKPKETLGDPIPGVSFFPYGHCFRCPLGLKPSSCEVNCLTYLENTLHDPNGGVHKPAAVILEMIQGEGGCIPAPRRFVTKLSRICTDNDILLIVDEVQTGCGRTGSWYSFFPHGIEPDIIVSSKALGAGVPLSVIFYQEHLDTWKPAAHTGTFRGNNLALAGNLAMLDAFREERVLENVERQGNYARETLTRLQETCAIIGDVRGQGLMLGVEVVDPVTGAASGALAKRVQQRAFGNGLIVELGGRNDCVVRLLPALNIGDEVMADGIGILADALRAASENL